MLSLSNWHKIAAALSAVAGALLAAAPFIGLDPAKVSAAVGDVQTIGGAAWSLLSVLGVIFAEIHINVQAMKSGTPLPAPAPQPPKPAPVSPGSAT
jgi:hypothetical protein